MRYGITENSPEAEAERHQQPQHVCGPWVDPDDCAACQVGAAEPAPPADTHPVCVWDHPGCQVHPIEER